MKALALQQRRRLGFAFGGRHIHGVPRTPAKSSPAELRSGDSVVGVLEDAHQRVIGASVAEVAKVSPTGLVRVAGERFEGAAFPLSQWHPRPQAMPPYVVRLYPDTRTL